MKRLGGAWLVIVFGALLPLASGSDGRVSGEHLAGLVSREAMAYFEVADRAAFLRRLKRTRISQALSGDVVAEPARKIARLAAALDVLLPPYLVEAVPEFLARGQGAAALSVEGFVLENGRPRPDVLFVADVRGLEGIVAALIEAGDSGSVTALKRFDLPFVLDPNDVPASFEHRSVQIVAFRTRGGCRIALAEHAGVLFGARTVQRVMMAIDRSIRASPGSLADSARYVDVRRRVDPGPGAAFWYADLRRLRQEDVFLPVRSGWAYDLLVDRLAGYDGIGLALRGAGERLRARVFLEAGSPGSRSGLEPGAAKRTFTFPSLLPEDVPVSLALWLDGRRAGEVLAEANGPAGGILSAAKLADYVGDLLQGDRLVSLLGGEFVLFQQSSARVGEPAPRLGFLLETADPAGVSRELERMARSLGPQILRGVEVQGLTCYELILAPNGYLARPAFAVHDRWLVGAVNAFTLRSVLRDVAAGGRKLADSSPWLAGFDDFDQSPEQPCLGILFLDSPRLAEALTGWQIGTLALSAPGDGDERAALMRALFLVLQDPDVQDALGGTMTRAEARQGGIVVDVVGP